MIKVLKPFSKDFLFSATIIDVDKTPNATSPNTIDKAKNVSVTPIPIATQKIIKRITNKNNCIGSSDCVFELVVFEVVNESCRVEFVLQQVVSEVFPKEIKLNEISIKIIKKKCVCFIL